MAVMGQCFLMRSVVSEFKLPETSFWRLDSKYCIAGGKCYLSCNTFDKICASRYARLAIVSTYNISSYCVWHVFMMKLRYLRKF